MALAMDMASEARITHTPFRILVNNYVLCNVL
jgi:hypothetical protein